jgi:hypothetical protein
LARTDRELSKLYAELIAQLPESQKKELCDDQQRWIEQRNTITVIPDAINDYRNIMIGYRLQTIYGDRMKELKTKLQELNGTLQFKPYRNEANGFELQYPKEFEVIPSSAVDNYPRFTRWANANVVNFAFAPLEPGGFFVWTEISIERGLTEEACIKVNPYPQEIAEIRRSPKLNGFFVDLPIQEVDSGWWRALIRNYMAFHKGICYTITRNMWNFPSEDKLNAELSMQDDNTIEIVKSFRFLDSESRDTP